MDACVEALRGCAERIDSTDSDVDAIRWVGPCVREAVFGHVQSQRLSASPTQFAPGALPFLTSATRGISHCQFEVSTCGDLHSLGHALVFEGPRSAFLSGFHLDERQPSGELEVSTQDIALMERVAIGDRVALAALYDRYGGALLALGQRVLSSRREAEDITHDVFLEVWRRADAYDPKRGSVRTWLSLIMRSRSLDRLRSAGFAWTQPLEGEKLDEVGAHPDGQIATHELREALVALTEPHREVLMLAYFEGLSSSEMAEELSLPLGTVKSRVAGALRALRVAMQDAPPARKRAR